MDKICELCQWWERRMLVLDEFTGTTVSLGHCATRIIGGLTAEDYTCGQWGEVRDGQDV
ncbi:hypothetical protein LCGC14_0653650 [marine sediment metagenome]|uniref:Uncharacterized protein n=1 Tax=marine sediment metagenome TaxID=412755 RepID=A0A0F9QVJ4_9ZZZZ